MNYKKCNKCQRPECNECKPLCEYTALPAEPCDDIEYCGGNGECFQIFQTNCIEFPDGTNLTEYLETFTEFVLSCCDDIDDLSTEIVISSQACCSDDEENPICPELSFNDTLMTTFCIPVLGDTLYLPLSAYVLNLPPDATSVDWHMGRCNRQSTIPPGMLFDFLTGELTVGPSVSPDTYLFNVTVHRDGCDLECVEFSLTFGDCGCSIGDVTVSYDEGSSTYSVDAEYSGCLTPVYTWEFYDEDGFIVSVCNATGESLFVDTNGPCVRYPIQLTVTCEDCSETIVLCEHLGDRDLYYNAVLNSSSSPAVIEVELVSIIEAGSLTYTDVNDTDAVVNFVNGMAEIPLPNLNLYSKVCIPVTVHTGCGGDVDTIFVIEPNQMGGFTLTEEDSFGTKCNRLNPECEDCSMDVSVRFAPGGEECVGCGVVTDCLLATIEWSNVSFDEGCVVRDVDGYVELTVCPEDTEIPAYVFNSNTENFIIDNSVNIAVCSDYEVTESDNVFVEVNPFAGGQSYWIELVYDIDSFTWNGTLSCQGSGNLITCEDN